MFGSQRCDCGPQLREAVERIADSGGYVLYLRQEGRGIGLYNKLEAYALQDAGLDTYETKQLRRFGVTVTARVPTGVHLSATNARYLVTKALRGGHTLDVPRSAG